MSNFMTALKKEKAKKDISGFQSIASEKAPFTYVEAYKSLRTNFEFISTQSNAKTILITSALPDESKTNVAINLAVCLATKGKKVIVVDCDLRKPMLHYYLKLEHVQTGLAAILKENSEINENIIYLNDLNISVVPVGKIPSNPSELLGIERMEHFVNYLRKEFDYVILDAPPVSVVTDAAVIGRVADGAIWVIRSKYASAYTIRMAKKKLEDLNIKILGAVITRYQPYKHREPYYYYYGYENKKRRHKKGMSD